MANSIAMNIRTAFVITSVLGLAACITRPHVYTKVVEGVRLEQYKTYKLEAGEIYDSESVKNDDPRGVRPALEADLREELEVRGLRLSDNNPDLTFRYVAGRHLEHAGEREWPYREGAVELTARDAAGRTVWSAHLQAMLDPSDKTHHQLKEAMARAFKNYPSVNE